MTHRDAVLSAIIVAAYLVLAIPAFSGLSSPDLMAAWAAAVAWMDGVGPALYGLSEGPFTTLAPPATEAAFDRIGYDSHRFAYIYAPLWLGVLGPLTEVLPWRTFLHIATWANCVMLAAMLWLAWRATGRQGPLPVFLLVGLTALCAGQIGGLALYQNQVQIAVSFLIVLAAERTEARAPIAAGMALALAAALKAYPVLFVVIWIGRSDWQALRAFAVTGGLLGAASIALTGWEMHAAFLDQISRVSATAMVSPVTFNLASLWAHLTGVTGMTPVDYGDGLPPQMVVAPLPPWLRVALSGALIAVLAVTWHRARGRDGLLWAAAAGGISLMTSVSWSFHYLVPMAFLPVLITRWGWAPGMAAIVILAGAVSFPMIPVWRALLDVFAPLQLSGTLAVGGVTVALWLALRDHHAAAPGVTDASLGPGPATGTGTRAANPGQDG